MTTNFCQKILRQSCILLLAAVSACGGGESTVQQPPAAARNIWVASWADAPDRLAGPAGAERTFREIVKPTVGSRGTVRLHFSNYFGTTPVTLGSVHVGLQTAGAAIEKDARVTFAGASSVTIAPGGSATSDNVALNFSYGQILAVTQYVSGTWNNLTSHDQGGGMVTSYATASNAGDKTGDLTGTSFTEITHETYLLDRIDVIGDYAGTIAAFGSSTTNGVNSGKDAHQSYPEQLADALHATGRDDLAVANLGISGNTLLGTNPTSGLVRFSRDVLGLPGVTHVIDYLGANDLRNDCATANAVINGKRDLIAQAHAAGLKIYEASTAPSTFCGRQSPGGYGTRFAEASGQEMQRISLSQWATAKNPMVINGITEAPPLADGWIDFQTPLADPANRSYLLPALNSGDDIHPNAAGYAQMAKAVPLSLF